MELQHKVTRRKRGQRRSAVNHVAIDLGSKESQVCMRDKDGKILVEKKYPTRKLCTWMAEWSSCRVILETSSEAFKIADQARAAGHEVRVVPSTLARQLGVGERGVKTDERDARKLSEVSCRINLPSVHIPSQATRELRSLVRSRELLLSMRTMSINHVRGWLRTQLGKLRKGTTTTFPERVRARAAEHEQQIPVYIEQVLVSIDTLNTQLLAARRQVDQLTKASPICILLMTIPGVGPVTALTFVAAIEDISRFDHAYQLTSYVGLTPGENSSSERERRTGITKAGSTSVRRTLVQAAWSAIRKCPNEPMVQWANQIADRRGKFIAVVALARKIAGIMFALWRDTTTYRSNRAALVTAL
jgi:transposase